MVVEELEVDLLLSHLHDALTDQVEVLPNVVLLYYNLVLLVKLNLDHATDYLDNDEVVLRDEICFQYGFS